MKVVNATCADRAGRNPHRHAQRENRIEHRAHGSGQLRAFIERLGVSHRAAAPDELCAISLAA